MGQPFIAETVFPHPSKLELINTGHAAGYTAVHWSPKRSCDARKPRSTTNSGSKGPRIVAAMTDGFVVDSPTATYFPGKALDGARLIDGGIWANNPAMVALTEAVGPLGLPLDAVRIFSVGTTTDLPHRSRRLDRGGLIPWARDAVDVLMRAQSDSATKQIRHFLGRDRVLRVNSTVPTGLVKLDSVDADSLIGRAGHESRVTSPEFTRCFADHTAPLYIPHSPKEK